MSKRKRRKAKSITNATMQLEFPAVEEQNVEKQVVRLFICGIGNLHIIATCPNCHSIEGELLFITVPGTFVGAATAKCTGCGETIAYFIDARKNGIWHMEAVDTKKSYILT